MLETNEPFLQFMFDTYKKSDEGFIRLNIVIESFKFWLKSNYPTIKAYNINRIKEILTNQDINVIPTSTMGDHIKGWIHKDFKHISDSNDIRSDTTIADTSLQVDEINKLFKEYFI